MSLPLDVALSSVKGAVLCKLLAYVALNASDLHYQADPPRLSGFFALSALDKGASLYLRYSELFDLGAERTSSSTILLSPKELLVLVSLEIVETVLMPLGYDYEHVC